MAIILDLTTIRPRHSIKLPDGEFPVRSLEDLPFAQQGELFVSGSPVQRALKIAAGARIEDRGDIEDLEKTVDSMVVRLVEAPDDVLGKLSVRDKLEIVKAIFESDRKDRGLDIPIEDPDPGE